MELSGLNVLVTRPKLYGEQLSLLIRKCGGHAVSLPMIKTEVISSIQPENPVTKSRHYAGIIFVSKIAAELGANLAKKYPLAKIYAMGEGTAKVLAKHDIVAEFASDSRSEALAELDSLKAITGEWLLIVKGEGGRTYLKEMLESRGNTVNNVDLYRRKSLVYPNEQLNNTLLNERINTVVVTSEQILRSFLYQVNYKYLKTINLIVPSQRIMYIALERKCSGVICSEGSDNNSVLNCLANLRKALIINEKLKIYS